MKTTVELPDELVRDIKLRAIHEGRKLKDVIADLLASALTAPQETLCKSGRSRKSLPVMKLRPIKGVSPQKMTGQELSDWIKEADLQMDVERYEAAFGRQRLDRPDD